MDINYAKTSNKVGAKMFFKAENKQTINCRFCEFQTAFLCFCSFFSCLNWFCTLKFYVIFLILLTAAGGLLIPKKDV